MKVKFTKLLIVILFLLSLASVFPHSVHTDPPDELDLGETYARAKVLQVLIAGIQNSTGSKVYSENLKVQFIEGVKMEKS